MKKSIFAKYFTMCATFVLVSITFLGAVLMIFASQYFKDEKYRLLQANAEKALAATYNTYNAQTNEISATELLPVFRLLASTTESNFFLTDKNGKTLFCSEGSSCNHTTYTIPEKILNIAAEGSYKELGKLGGVNKERYFTVGLPMVNADGSVVGYVFGTTNSNALNQFLMELLKMFFVSSIAVLILAFVVAYFVTLKMVQPLKKMSAVAQQYGRGDFSNRLEIESCDEVGQLAMTLNNMAQSLSVSESMRRSFVANVSHELKTPLMSISGYAELMMNGMVPPDKIQDFSGRIFHESERLSNLVADIIQLSRLDEKNGETMFEQVDIGELGEDVINNLQNRAAKKKINLEYTGESAQMQGVRHVLYEMFYNITDNAIRYTQDGGDVKVFVGKLNGKPYFRVEDNGIGIPESEQQRIFERFYRVDKSHSRETGGTGLGLSIVKHGAVLHHAKILLDSEPGKGTKMEILFDQTK